MANTPERTEQFAALDSMEGLPPLEPLPPAQESETKPLDSLPGVLPGVLACIMAGLAAAWISEHHGGPTMLYALFFGMSVNFLSQEGRCVDGIQLASKMILRLGVALLGFGITFEQILSLGPGAIGIILVSVPLTVLFGVVMARRLSLEGRFGMLTGGAVAICGASAALAISSVMPKSEHLERDTMLAVVGVTTLSTLVMIIYPTILAGLEFSDQQSGVFLGATIHDVAQVVGAGYSISPEAGGVATFVKLMRVAMLLPFVMVFSLWFRRVSAAAPGAKVEKPPLLPLFLIGFIVAVLIRNSGLLPDVVLAPLSQFSRWCLVTAIAAIGMQTSFKILGAVGWRPVGLMIGQTLFLAVLVLALLIGRF